MAFILDHSNYGTVRLKLALPAQRAGALGAFIRGHEVMVRFTNKMASTHFANEPPCTATRTGRPFSTHLHGSESLAPFDGWAEDEICGGESKEYIYPNQHATTAWYHDHALHITLENAYHGLAGMYIMSDKVKDGGCGAPYNLEDKASAAAAQVPQLLLLPPQEVSAKLEALSQSMKVPLDRVPLVAADKPILLSQSAKTIKEAAAKLPKQ